MSLIEGISVSEEYIEQLYDNWKSGFTVQLNEDFSNIPIYSDDYNNKFVIGGKERIYDRFIPIVGVYENSNLTGSSPISTPFKIKMSGDGDNVRHFVLCLLPEKVCFKATNSQTENEFVGDGGTRSRYISEEKQEFYTGRAKLVMLFNTENNVDFISEEEESYSMIREIGEPFDFYTKQNFKNLINYIKMYHEDVANLLNVEDTGAVDYPRLGCNVTLLFDNEPKFSQTFLVKPFDTYGNLDVGFGIPLGGQYNANKFIPYNSTVFENADIDFIFSDVKITSPTYTLNRNIAIYPSSIDNDIDLIVPDIDPSAAPLRGHPVRLLLSWCEGKGTADPVDPRTARRRQGRAREIGGHCPHGRVPCDRRRG